MIGDDYRAGIQPNACIVDREAADGPLLTRVLYRILFKLLI